MDGVPILEFRFHNGLNGVNKAGLHNPNWFNQTRNDVKLGLLNLIGFD